MAYTLALNYVGSFNVTETADSTTSPGSTTNGNARVFDQYGLTVRLTNSTTPALSGSAIDLTVTLGASAESFDLTAAPVARDLAETVDMTGKKLVAWCIKASTSNAGNITINPHATNGYPLFGSSGLLVVGPGRHVMSCLASGESAETTAVAAGAKVIEVSGTQNDVINMLLIFA